MVVYLILRFLDSGTVQRWVECYEDQESLRGQLEGLGLVAFVPDGAVLPREAGDKDTPLRGNVVKFTSPPSLSVTVRGNCFRFYSC